MAARFGPRPAENPNAPDPQDLLRELHRAVYGDTWARPEPPEKIWRELIQTVDAWRIDALGGKVMPHGGMPAWFEPFARGCAQGLEKGRNDALADAVGLARFIEAARGRTVVLREHLEMMRRGPRLHDDSCPACKWIEELLEAKTHIEGETP